MIVSSVTWSGLIEESVFINQYPENNVRYKARKKASDAKITNIMPMMIAPFRLIRNQSARLPNMVSIIKDIITPVIPFVIVYSHFVFSMILLLDALLLVKILQILS